MKAAHVPYRALILAMILAALAEPRAAGPARPVQLATGAADAVIKSLQKDREDTEKWLRSDATSYLATIARRDFGEKETLTVGRAADNDVRIEASGISPHHLRVTVVIDRFHVEGVDPQARFKVKAAEKNETRDATSDHDTYALGRYVDPKKLPNSNYVLDFNAAYNPACAFSDHYNCPIPPKANTLAVAIRAGEMDSHYH